VEVKSQSNQGFVPHNSRLSLAGRCPRVFPELLDEWVKPHGNRVFLPRRRARSDEAITFRRLLDDQELLSAGLAGLGIRRGDRVGLLAENRYEWLLADLATTYIGAVDVPRGSDTSPAEILFILQHSGCRAAFVEDDATAQAVLEAHASLPALETLISLGEETRLPGVLTLRDAMERGRQWLDNDRARLRELGAAVQGDDLLTIVYTSGTTAEPKGVMLTHDNVLSNLRDVCEVLDITESDTFLSVLPAWHMYERILDYCALAVGGQLIYTDRRRLKEDLEQQAPTVFAAVPRIWETIHDGIVGHAQRLAGIKGRLLRGALALARKVGSGRANLAQRAVHRVLQPLVLKQVLAITGGRLRLAVSGGGALPRHVDECLLGIGLPLLNGYGLTETSPVAALRRPGQREAGTIGAPLPRTSIEARDGEGRALGADQTGVLWIRGPQVMRGYYRNPGKTAEVLDADGWFNSGDLGHVDARGCIWITGRAKDTIVLAGGENVEPEPVEAAIKTSTFIDQAVVVGQDQKHLGALLVPNHDALSHSVPREQWDEHDGLLHGKPVIDLLRRELDRLLARDRGFRPVEKIAAFRVLYEPLTVENGFLTKTLKVRRHVVHEQLADVIGSMFKSHG
jgi:long-chain acyl-CoA synthetase